MVVAIPLLLFAFPSFAQQSDVERAVSAAERSAAAAESQMGPLWLQVWLAGVGTFFGLSALTVSIVTAASNVSTSRRELRAYLQTVVTNRPANLRNGAIWVAIKNVGQTPAYNVTVTAEVMLFPRPISEVSDTIVRRRVLQMAQSPSEMTIGAGIEIGEDRPLVTTEKEADRIVDGTLEIVYAGKVVYLDVFGKRHSTYFCHRYGFANGEWYSNFHERGNHAT